MELCYGVGNRPVQRLEVSREASKGYAEVGAATNCLVIMLC